MGIGEAIGWILISIVKFILTPSVMISAGKSFLYTWIISSIGATIGLIFFYTLGSKLIDYINSHRKKKSVLTKSKIKIYRFIIKKGLGGLMLIGPILSVPITGMIAARFFHHHKKALPILILTFIVWSFVLSLISHGIKSAI